MSLFLAPADLAKLHALARRTAAGSAGVAAPVAGASTVTAAAVAACEDGPLALDGALERVDRVARSARHRDTGDGDRVAPPRLSVVLDMEEPPAHRPTDRARRRARADSDDVADEPAMGRASNPRRTPETRNRRQSVHGCERHGPPSTSAVADVAHVLGEPRRTDHGRGCLCGADRDGPPPVRLGDPGPRTASHRSIAVTEHPTAEWTAQQLREAFPWDQAPRYVVRDRDHAFDGWAAAAKAMGIDEVLRPPAPRGKTRTSNGSSDPRDARVSILSSC
jgi:hypothetical protein